MGLLRCPCQVRKTPSNAPPARREGLWLTRAVPFLILATQAILYHHLSICITVRAPCIGETLCDHYRDIAVSLRFQPRTDILCTRLFDTARASFPKPLSLMVQVRLYGAKFQPIAWYILSPTELRSYCMLTGPTSQRRAPNRVISEHLPYQSKSLALRQCLL